MLEVALRNLLTRCHLQLVGQENGLVPVWGKSPLHLLGRVLLLLNSLDAKRSLIFICVHPLGQGLVIKGESLWIESLRVMSHSERSPIHRTVAASGDTAPGVVDMPPPASFIVAACKGCLYPQNNNSSVRTYTQILPSVLKGRNHVSCHSKEDLEILCQVKEAGAKRTQPAGPHWQVHCSPIVD